MILGLEHFYLSTPPSTLYDLFKAPLLVWKFVICLGCVGTEEKLRTRERGEKEGKDQKKKLKIIDSDMKCKNLRRKHTNYENVLCQPVPV